MHKFPFLLLTLALLAPQNGLAGEKEQVELEAFVQESRLLVKAFAGELKGALQAAIQKGGPVQAIGVCNVRAPEIARAVPSSAQWTVGRTSHKLRNTANAPDDWEAGVLAEFLRRTASGETPAGMETAALVERDGGQVYRYMKAIPLGEVCLTCHGADIEPALEAEIDSLYPDDRATGFALGEFRGAFTITKRRDN